MKSKEEQLLIDLSLLFDKEVVPEMRIKFETLARNLIIKSKLICCEDYEQIWGKERVINFYGKAFNYCPFCGAKKL